MPNQLNFGINAYYAYLIVLILYAPRKFCYPCLHSPSLPCDVQTHARPTTQSSRSKQREIRLIRGLRFILIAVLR